MKIPLPIKIILTSRPVLSFLVRRLGDKSESRSMLCYMLLVKCKEEAMIPLIELLTARRLKKKFTTKQQIGMISILGDVYISLPLTLNKKILKSVLENMRFSSHCNQEIILKIDEFFMFLLPNIERPETE